MAGKTDMTLFGWKQLIQWSLEHACIDPEARREMTRQWEKHWDVFTRWINETDWSQPVDRIPFPEAPMPDPPRRPSRP
jgi:adenosine deaminase CECR1